MRYLLATLLGLTLLTPFVMRLVLADDGSDSASAEMRRLVIVTPHNNDIRREFAEAFDRWHRSNFGSGVEIDYRTPGGTTQITRLLRNIYEPHLQEDGTFPADVPADIHIVWGGGDFVFNVELKGMFDGQGVLEPVAIDPQLLAEAYPQPDIAGIRLYDGSDVPTWYGVCLSSFGIVYSPDLVKVLGLEPPTTWDDLTDPALFGKIALADPTKSGSAAVSYHMVIQRAMQDAVDAAGNEDPATLNRGWVEGMRTLTRIAANSRYFTDSASQVPHDVAQADAAAGMAIDFYGGVYEDQVGSDRIRFVRPKSATAITPDPVAVLRGVDGEALETSRRFMEFLLTPEAQQLWIRRVGQENGPRKAAMWRPPIRRDAYGDTTGWTDASNPFVDVGDFNQRSDWMAEFSDLRNVWAAAWMDAGETLEHAAARIMELGDSIRRDQLLDELGTPPKVTLEDAAGEPVTLTLDREGLLALRGLRKGVEATEGADVQEWQARTRIRVAEAFRRHYDAVAAKAE